MRLAALLLGITALHLSAAVRAQKVTIEQTNISLKQALQLIHEQTGYAFFGDQAVLDNAAALNLSIKDASLTEALDQCLKGLPYEYEIKGNFIYIRPKKETAATVAAPAVLGPPPEEVHGRVTDSAGTPLAGASVTVKGSKKGTQTDTKGEFVLKGVGDDAALVVSFTGYEQQVVRASADHVVHVVLKHSDNPLDQVQIIAYGTSSRRMLTGDVSTVKSTEIEEQPVTDPLLALEGRVPGLYIQQTSGIPGAYSTVRIMGQNSIANGNDPLYVVDGVPYSSVAFSSPDMSGGAVGSPVLGQPNSNPGQGISPFNALNPADIESIDVLKDADATAIYGSRGANGVVLITTKKGKAGTTRVDVNLFGGSSQVTRKIDLLNTRQYLEMRHEAYRNDGITAIPANAYDLNGVWDTTRYTDWQKVLIDNPAHFANGQMSISGGNTNTQFVVSGGYGVQGTVFPGDFFDKKGSAYMSISHASSDRRFSVQATASYTNDNNQLPATDITSQIKLAPDAPSLYDAKGNVNWQIYNGAATWTNPIIYKYFSSAAVTNNLVSSLNLAYEILPGLQLKGNVGYNHAQMNQTLLSPETLDGKPPYNVPQYSYNEFATNDFQTWILEPQANYDRKWRLSRLDILIGTTFQQNVNQSKTIYASGYTSDALINNPLSATTQQIEGDEYTLYHYAAVFGRISYDWARKYLISVTARRDGSSRFGPGKQFGDFGSAGLGWVFSEEKIIRNSLSFLSFGKIRASYGISGNDQLTDYQYLSTYSSIGTSYQANTGLYPSRIANPYYSWEVVKKLQVGLDFGFLKDRLLFSDAWYRNRDNNQLVGYPLSSVTGFTSIQSNFPALVQNAGEEFTVNAVIVKTKDLSWSSSVNLTLPENKLVAYPNFQNSSYTATYKVGYSLFSSLRFPYAGVNPATGTIEYYSQTYKADTTKPAYPQDLGPTKPITQNYYGGWQNSLTYKNFQLDIFIQIVKQLGQNYAVNFPLAGSVNVNEPLAVLGRWQMPGDMTDIPKFSSKSLADPHGELTLSNYYIADASFVRVKNVALSYRLPQDWLRKARMQTARLYLQCQNLFTWTKYKGLDPETQGLHLPPLRTVTAGLEVAF